MRGRALLIPVFLTVSIGHALAGDLTGSDWDKHSDSFQIGYAVGFAQTTIYLAEISNFERPTFHSDLAQCITSRSITVGVIKSTIDGYIRNNPKDKDLRLAVIAGIALSRLCGL